MKKLFIGVLSFYASTLCASVGADLDSFFNGIGFASNTTEPGAYESQAAGFYGGGGIYARNGVRQYQLVQLDLPSYRAGCGGIDLYMGSLSFLKSDKLVELGKHVMTNGGAYAVDVMLATTVPELKDVRDYLQNIEQAANHASVNSCEMGQNLVGGIFPKTAESQKKICKDQGLMGDKGYFSDYVNARMGCSGADFNKSMEAAKKDKATEKQVVLNKNIVWSMLQENPFLSGDQELSEMLMSLTGTLIFDGDGKVTNVPSLSTQSNIIDALLGINGKHDASIWKCQDAAHCLKVAISTLVIPEASTLNFKVKKIIEDLNQKVREDTAITEAEKSFLSLTPFPILKFLTVANSSPYANASADISEFSNLIAQDLLENYLTQLLDEVTIATQGSVLNEDLIKDIQARIKNVKIQISNIEPKVRHRLNQKLSLIQYSQNIEKQVANGFSE